MKRWFTPIYWVAAVPLVALVLWSAMGSLPRAFFLSVMLLPGVLFFKYFAGDSSFKNRRQGIFHTICFVAIVMLIEYLGIFFVYLNVVEYPYTESPRSRFITFISDCRRTTLELASILYIESHDDEVMVVTADSTRYPTRMKISQWETALDDRFVRVHRSFIVSRLHITRIDAHAVWLSDLPVEISRKYRDRLTTP